MKRQRALAQAVVVVMLVILLPGCRLFAQLGQNVDPTPAPTAAEAEQAPVPDPQHSSAILEFSGESDLALVPESSQARPFGGTSQRYTATSPEGDPLLFEVDAETGEVVRFLRGSEPAYEVTVDLSTAKSAARSFVEQHYAGFSNAGLDLARAELVDLGAGTAKFYTFWWIERDPDSGAYLPNEVKVQVNAATGEIDTYAGQRVDVTVATEPAVDRETASTTALEALPNLPGARATATTLAVSTLPVGEPGGEQALLWQVVIEGAEDANGYIPGASVFLDAQTGEIVHVSPF